ncbi:MAG: regulatory iron-sulfur-containing complex subunit RicT [Flavobacteriaceae bacterium]|nr:regulatory iron-sulfur-containing complex subunit RicT [Flavobacteriaceae bacterium]
MGCNGCDTRNGTSKGCGSNGGCTTGSCNKLTVFDWLSNMSQPVGVLHFPYVEIRFKNERKEFFHQGDLRLNIGDIVAVAAQSGHDLGVVSLTGDLVRTQMKRKSVDTESNLPIVYRIANQRDIDVWQSCREKEHQMMIDARRIAREIGLDMKISDVEYQGDGTKATFYYTSESRVDFRQLIRDYASIFKTRIEMRQIGYRQEASKVGGIGSCGRELCCSTWLTDFRTVSTAAARYQQLSINPAKIAGQCGKLKCCLNYELDSYLDAIKEFPKSDIQIETANGKAYCAKIDVFKREIWLAYTNPQVSTWFKFTVDQVKEFIKEGNNKKPIKSLEELNLEFNEPENIFNKDIVEESSMERFENQRSSRRRPRKRPVNSRKSPEDKPQQNTGQKQNTRKKRYNNNSGKKRE